MSWYNPYGTSSDDFILEDDLVNLVEMELKHLLNQYGFHVNKDELTEKINKLAEILREEEQKGLPDDLFEI